MSSMETRRRLLELDLAYTQFNAARTLGDARPSEFRVESVGDLTVTVDPARAASYYNRILGLSAASLHSLDSALAVYEDGEASPRVDVAAGDREALVEDALAARGFRPGVQLAYLETTPHDIRPVPPTDTQIECWGPADADRFLDLLDPEARISREIRELRREHYCTDRFRTFVAFVGGAPVAWATLFVHEALGLLGNALTQEAFRNRGLHTALLGARMRAAGELGVDWLLSDVEADTISQRNCERFGLRVLTVHTIWQHPD